MRDAFHEDLDRISDELVEMTRLASSAMSRASRALLDADLQLAESVIAADEQLDEKRSSLDALSIDVLARQQPVATDLRIVVTSMRMSSDIERMGDLARHIAKIARLRYPVSAVPPELRAHFTDMSQVAEALVTRAGSIIASKDTDSAAAMELDDDRMDELHRTLFAALHDSEDLSTEQVVDLTLLGRYYERFGDHAVSVARRVTFLVTGEFQAEGEFDHEEREDAAVEARLEAVDGAETTD